MGGVIKTHKGSYGQAIPEPLPDEAGGQKLTAGSTSATSEVVNSLGCFLTCAVDTYVNISATAGSGATATAAATAGNQLFPAGRHKLMLPARNHKVAVLRKGSTDGEVYLVPFKMTTGV